MNPAAAGDETTRSGRAGKLHEPSSLPDGFQRALRDGTRAHCRTAGYRLQWQSQVIITRSPLRISLGGGGTDLPSYYREHTGFLIAAAIDKYVYITLHQTFAQELIVKYSQAGARQRASTRSSTRSSARR